MKVKINQEECIGCGSCMAVCGEVFEINNKNKAIIKGTMTDENKDGSNEGETDNQCAKEAADICPVQVIEVEE